MSDIHRNQLYFGDNLHILREALVDETVDLIYLDPPFNSKRDYNLLFKSPKGQQSEAQITAFADSWHWGEQAEREFNELLHQPNGKDKLQGGLVDVTTRQDVNGRPVNFIALVRR